MTRHSIDNIHLTPDPQVHQSLRSTPHLVKDRTPWPRAQSIHQSFVNHTMAMVVCLRTPRQAPQEFECEAQNLSRGDSVCVMFPCKWRNRKVQIHTYVTRSQSAQ